MVTSLAHPPLQYNTDGERILTSSTGSMTCCYIVNTYKSYLNLKLKVRFVESAPLWSLVLHVQSRQQSPSHSWRKHQPWVNMKLLTGAFTLFHLPQLFNKHQVGGQFVRNVTHSTYVTNESWNPFGIVSIHQSRAPNIPEGLGIAEQWILYRFVIEFEPICKNFK